jgi:hypothetical protein
MNRNHSHKLLLTVQLVQSESKSVSGDFESLGGWRTDHAVFMRERYLFLQDWKGTL